MADGIILSRWPDDFITLPDQLLDPLDNLYMTMKDTSSPPIDMLTSVHVMCYVN